MLESSAPRQQLQPIQAAPKYLSLAQRLLRHIAAKRLRPGDFLGTEAELVSKHGVSRVTVRQALLMLEKDGYISREKARGTFVKKAVHPSLNIVRGTVVLACSNEQTDHLDEDFAFATVLRAMERSLTRRGYTSQILGFGADVSETRTRLRELANHEDLEGICAIGPCLESCQDALPDVPLVTACTFLPTGSLWVGPDSRTACRTSIEYLIGKGHRDIAMVCSAQLDQRAYAIFASAYAQSFEAAGLRCPRHLMYHAYIGESLRELAGQMLTGPSRPTAVFAENWKVCQLILAIAGESGIRIPDDLSLVGFGRNVLQILYPVPVTAYVPDHDKIGEQAVEVLSATIDGQEPGAPMEVLGKLVERDSVRAIASGSGDR